ncbi:hypothetical protein V8C35DRAFT_315721 [Trichoderma chlorosporum]
MKPVFTSTNITSAARSLHPIKMRNTSSIPNTWRIHQSCKTTTNDHVLVRQISGYPHLRNKRQNNEELPSFSFEGLGMSKNAKIFVIVVLSIFGTIETWVWCKGIYRWWNSSSEKE